MHARVELIWANQTQLVAGQRMQTHLHACHQLYYILEGEAVFVIGDKQLPVQAGSCFLVPAMMPHEMLPVRKGSLRSYELKLFVRDPSLLLHLQENAAHFSDHGTIRRLLRYVVETGIAGTNRM